MSDNKKHENAKDGKDGKDEIKGPSPDRRDLSQRWNPLGWFSEMERRLAEEFQKAGFGRWLGSKGDLGAEGDDLEGKSSFTKGEHGKSSGWSYNFQTGMDAPEIRTWGDVKPEDVEGFLGKSGWGTPSLGPGTGKAGESGEGTGGPAVDGETDAGEAGPEGWDPFRMFSDIFEGFSRPFFQNMGKMLGGAPQLGQVDAAKMAPTVETPATPGAETAPQEPTSAVAPTTGTNAGKSTTEPFADVITDKDGNLVATLEVPGATEASLKVTVEGQTIRVEAEGPLRQYRKEITAPFPVDPKKVESHVCNGIAEVKAVKG